MEKQAERQQELSVRLESIESDMEDLSSTLKTTQSSRVKLDEELDAASETLAAKSRLDLLGSEQKATEETLERKRKEKHAVLASAWQDLLDVKLSAKRRLLLKQQEILTQTLKEQGRLQLKIENLRNLINTCFCPTCEQEISSDRKVRIAESLDLLFAESYRMKDGSLELQVIAGQLAMINNIRGINAKERLAGIEQDLVSGEVTLQRIENEIERINFEIEGQDTAELARKRIVHQEFLKEEGRLQNQIANCRKEIEKIRLDLSLTQKAIEAMSGMRSQRSTIKLRIATDLERVFNLSIERLRERLRGEVQLLATAAFKAMSTQKQYSGLEINSNYGLSILDENGDRLPLRSAGAEQVVALSLIDGLNRLGRAIGPIVMDTPFGRLDLKHRDNILSYLPSVSSQFVLLVHSGEVRIETDLALIKHRVGKSYIIKEIGPSQSRIEEVVL
jgi:DNA sulfur modification protein DndD